MTDWNPRWSDLAWTRRLIKTLNEGGSWAQPGSCTIFTFYHSKKEYKVDESRCTDPEMVARTRKVLSVLEWKEGGEG